MGLLPASIKGVAMRSLEVAAPLPEVRDKPDRSTCDSRTSRPKVPVFLGIGIE